MGQEVLELWVEELVASGQPLPKEGISSMTILNTKRPKIRRRSSRQYALARAQRG